MIVSLAPGAFRCCSARSPLRDHDRLAREGLSGAGSRVRVQQDTDSSFGRPFDFRVTLTGGAIRGGSHETPIAKVS
jgi:hypothetical protein